MAGLLLLDNGHVGLTNPPTIVGSNSAHILHAGLIREVNEGLIAHPAITALHGREDNLPVYALGPGHRPRKEIAEILKIFGDAKDGWSKTF